MTFATESVFAGWTRQAPTSIERLDLLARLRGPATSVAVYEIVCDPGPMTTTGPRRSVLSVLAVVDAAAGRLCRAVGRVSGCPVPPRAVQPAGGASPTTARITAEATAGRHRIRPSGGSGLR